MIELQKMVREVLLMFIKFLRDLFRYPLDVVNNVSRILRFSIRSKITLTYLIIYTWVTIISTVSVLGGYYYYNIEKITTNEYSQYEEIQTIMGNVGRDSDQLQTSLNTLDLGGVDVLIQNSSKETLAVTTDSFAVNNYEMIKNSKRFYRSVPSTSLLVYSIYPRVNVFEEYNIIFFYNVQDQLYTMFIMALLMFFSYIIGFIFIWIVGSLKIKKVLKPIKQFTKSAQSINAKNLDIRIDVREAKYELKDLAVTINGMMDRIEESYVKQQQFVSDVSHELRTPISVIGGYANMLDRWGKENPEVLQESIDALKNEASNMGELVEKLLFLARYDGDTITYEMISIDLSEIVEEIAYETEMIDTKHPIIRDISKSLIIKGDYNRIKQVIRVFTDNAIKYTLQGGNIIIRAYNQGSMAVVSIKDTGIGISEKDLTSIFDRFYRTDKSRTKNKGGYGLGLSIAKIIVLQHGGKIIVRSKLGVGSEFKILIPLVIGDGNMR